MSRNGSGTYTIPSSEYKPAASGGTLTAANWNTLIADLEAAISASIASDGQTTTSARIPFASGVSTLLGSTSAVPYCFTGDTNTGIYSPAADKVGIVAGGTEQIRIESAVIAPIANNTVDLGSSSNKFKDGYFAGALTVGSMSGYTPTSGLVSLLIEDAINNGETSKAPTENAVYDALALKAAKATNTFTGAQIVSETTLTSSSNSIAIDLSANNCFKHTFTENTTLANPTNVVAGQSGRITFTQHASSPKTLAFGSYWLFPATENNGSDPAVTATNSAIDVLYYDVLSPTQISCHLSKGLA